MRKNRKVMARKIDATETEKERERQSENPWVERVEASRYLDSGDSGMYLKRPVGWWIGPPKRRVACGAR